MIPFQVRPGPLYRTHKPVRDPLYRRFVKQLPCVGCGKTWQIDPAHCGPHGISQKACDLTVIPLCRKCHEQFDAAPADFAATRKLDVPALQRMFQRFYVLKNGATDWWPNQPNLTLQACPECEVEAFQVEIEIAGCARCGYRPKERAA